MLLRSIIICIMSTATSRPPLRDTEVRSPGVLASQRGPAIPFLQSLELFGQSREIMIEHDGSYYRLRVTHSNKLILTK
jgi:hemin uptake protein HemP